jgi:LmbE family N-acetylglucosaminyl deacetylase
MDIVYVINAGIIGKLKDMGFACEYETLSGGKVGKFVGTRELTDALAEIGATKAEYALKKHMDF